MSIVGKSEIRVDAFDKATGRTKYYEDRMPGGALYVRIKHAEIAHGFVKSVDTSEAEQIKGVVKVLTCFDVPEIDFPTAGHPWSMDPGHQDVADRRLLNRHVRYWGDDVAVVIAEDEVAAMQGSHGNGGKRSPTISHSSTDSKLCIEREAGNINMFHQRDCSRPGQAILNCDSISGWHPTQMTLQSCSA